MRVRWPSTLTVRRIITRHLGNWPLITDERHISRCTACGYYGQQVQAVLIITGRRHIIRHAANSLPKDCPRRMTKFRLEASHRCLQRRLIRQRLICAAVVSCLALRAFDREHALNLVESITLREFDHVFWGIVWGLSLVGVWAGGRDATSSTEFAMRRHQ